MICLPPEFYCVGKIRNFHLLGAGLLLYNFHEENARAEDGSQV